MSLQNIKQMREERGFTLVELLIVIVIIAILAAIIIVAYNGITQRAHTSAAQQAAQNVANKSEAYNAEAPGGSNGYPTTFGTLTGAQPSMSYYLPTGAAYQATAAMTAAPTTGDKTINFFTCTDTKVNVGVMVGYWDFGAGSEKYINQGTVTPVGSATPTTTANGNVTCTIAAT